MVHPKHHALSPSSRKKIKTSTVTEGIKTSTNTDVSHPAMSLELGAFSPIHDMLSNFNTMIAMNVSSIKTVEATNAKNTSMVNEKFDALLRHIKILERRIEDIEDVTNADAENREVVGRAVGTLVDTADVLESRLSSIGSRVSSIERTIIRSNKRKLGNAGHK